MIHPKYQGALYAYFVYVEKHFRKGEEKMRRIANKWLTIIPNQVRHIINSTLTFLAKSAGKGKAGAHYSKSADAEPRSKFSKIHTGHSEVGPYDELDVNQAPQSVEQL